MRDDVLKATSNAQGPFVYGSLGGNDVTLVPAATAPAAAAAPVDQDATMRRDYEFALQIATKPVLGCFRRKYPSGFFTALAKAHRDKIAAEAARIEATNKAKAAQEEQTRLAIEGAKAQNRQRQPNRPRQPKRPASPLNWPTRPKRPGRGSRTCEDGCHGKGSRRGESCRSRTRENRRGGQSCRGRKDCPEQRSIDDKVATLTPPAGKSDQQTVDLPRSLQSELRRVGCHTGSIDSNWNAASQRSLDLFNKHTGMKLDVKVASVDALDAVKSKPTRICPLICEHGFKADGDLCTKITCRAGYEVGDDNTCEKIEVKKPTAKREEPKAGRDLPGRAKTASEPAKPQASSGQVLCNQQGCRPVGKGCRMVYGEATTGRAG